MTASTAYLFPSLVLLCTLPPSRHTPRHRYTQSLTSPARPTVAMSITIHAPLPSLHLNPSRPTSPLPQHHPPPRPPSRSERMLRDALLRDELERQHPPQQQLSSSSSSPTTPSSSRKRHQHAHPRSSDLDSSADPFYEPNADHAAWTRHTFMFRSAMVSPSTNPPSPNLTRKKSHRRSLSPPPPPSSSSSPTAVAHRCSGTSGTVVIPTKRRNSGSISHTGSPPGLYAGLNGNGIGNSNATGGNGCLLTPHEQVLRARLERVLGAAAAGDDKRMDCDGHSASKEPSPAQVYKWRHSLALVRNYVYFF
jgi:hypothetical protein